MNAAGAMFQQISPKCKSNLSAKQPSFFTWEKREEQMSKKKVPQSYIDRPGDSFIRAETAVVY